MTRNGDTKFKTGKRCGNVHAEELLKGSPAACLHRTTSFTWQWEIAYIAVIPVKVPILNVLLSLMNGSSALTNTDVLAGFGSINHLDQSVESTTADAPDADYLAMWGFC
jgi:hypothetical protein